MALPHAPPPPAPADVATVSERTPYVKSQVSAEQIAQLRKLINVQPCGYGYGSSNLTYGELKFDGVLKILQDAHYRRGGIMPAVLLDLGAGTGKVPIVAAAVHAHLRRGIGIELVKERYNISMQTLEDAESQFPTLNIQNRVLLLQGDMTKNVAAVAAADVVWIANTCYGEELNKEVARLLDDYAPEGALVYYCHPLTFKRCKDGKPASLEVTWAESHGYVAHMRGTPLQLRDCNEEEYGFSDFIDRAFERWATFTSIIEADVLRAAVAAALLPEFSADQLLQELYTSDGALACLCEEDLVENSDGLSYYQFRDLCVECQHALRGGEGDVCQTFDFASAFGSGNFFADLSNLLFRTCRSNPLKC